DGIRDDLVTGVQTCALPIFMALATKKLDKLMQPVFELRAELGLPRGKQPVFGGQHSPTKVLALFSKLMAKPQLDWPRDTVVTGRSEERRVGKEGGSGVRAEQ